MVDIPLCILAVARLELKRKQVPFHLDSQPALLQDLPHHSLKGRFALLNAPAREIIIQPIPEAIEQQLPSCTTTALALTRIL